MSLRNFQGQSIETAVKVAIQRLMRFAPGKIRKSISAPGTSSPQRKVGPQCRNGVEGWCDRGVTLEYQSQR